MDLFDLQAKITLDSNDYESKLRDASEAQSIFAQDLDRVVGSTDSMEQALVALRQEYNENEMRAKDLKAAMDELASGGDTSSAAFQELSYNLAETQQYSDALTDKMKALSSAEKDNDKSATGAGKSTSFFGDMIKANLGSDVIKKGIETMKQLVVETAEYGDAIDKQSQKLGISASAYQEWEAVLQHSGTSMGAMSATFKTLANAAQDASDDQVAAFERIGLSMDEVANMATEDLFGAVITGLQNMESGTERTAIATDLLGRGTMELGALLNTTAEDTQAMIDRVNELGGVMSDEGVEASADFQDAVQDLKTALQASARDIGTAVLPVLTDIINGATDAMAEMRNLGIDQGINQFDSYIDKIKAARENVDKWKESLAEAAEDPFTASPETLRGLENAQKQLESIRSEVGAQQEVFAAFADGELSAADAADLLGISVEQMYRQLRGAAEEERKLAEATEEATEEIDEQAEAAKKTHDAIIDIASAAIDARYSGENLRDEYDKLSAELDKLRETGEAYDISLAEQQLATLNLAATNQELASGFPTITSRLEGFRFTLTQTSQWLISNGITAEDWGNRVMSATNTVINGFSELDTSIDMSLDDMAANLESNIAAYDSWNSNIETLMAAAVESGDQARIGFVQHLQDMGIGAADQVAAMMDDVDGNLKRFGELWGQAADEGMTQVYDQIKGADVSTATSEMMDKAVTAIEETDFKTSGEQIPQEVAQGIESNDYLVSMAAEGVVTSAKTSADSYTDDFYSVGYNMDAGMVSGIQAGASKVVAAAEAVARKAYEASKAILKINSPSKLFRDDIGMAIPEGIAAGIDKGAGYVVDSIGALADKATGAFQMGDVTTGLTFTDAQPAFATAGYGGTTINNYFTVNGAESPEDYAFRLSRTLEQQTRMA